jgi:hypothetical protein
MGFAGSSYFPSNRSIYSELFALMDRMLMNRIISVFLVTLTISVGISSHVAVADDWLQLPDGWVEIAIKSAKFRLPTTSDQKNIRFNEFAKARKMTLQQVLSFPDAAAADFKDHPNVVFSMYVGLDPAGFFLGKFRNSDLRSFAFSFNIGQNQGNCESWAEYFDQTIDPGSFSDKFGDGWSDTAVEPKMKQTFYRRLVVPKDGHFHFQNLHCNALNECGSSICLSKQLSFDFAFSNRYFPRSTWSEVAKKAETILETVLLDPGAKE